MKKWGTLDTLSAGLVLGLFVLTGALYPSLPEQMPTHFDIRGRADGWMSRPAGAWALPIVTLATWALVRFGGRLLPRAWRGRMQRSPMDVIGLVLAALLGALQCGILYAATRGIPSIGVFLALVLGISWVALGLVLPRVRRNPFVGIRTPWSLTSDENWARTHRLGSHTFVGGGLLSMLLAGAGIPIGSIAVIVASALLPAVYSFVLARRLASDDRHDSTPG